MVAFKTKDLLYVCWPDESTTVLRAKFDTDLWQMMETEIKEIC